MILLIDRINLMSERLIKSFQKAEIECDKVSCDYDGFLPEDIDSPYKYFTSLDSNGGNDLPCPRFFDRLETPRFWEISGTMDHGEIHNFEDLRAIINYSAEKEKRYIKSVDWLDRNSEKAYTDYYDNVGKLYARSFYSVEKKPTVKMYLSEDGMPVITENLATGAIFLNYKGGSFSFDNRTQFVMYYFNERGLNTSELMYNSLSTPFFVSLALEEKQQNGSSILFWQEEIGDVLPQNMVYLFNNENNRTKKICVQNRKTYRKIIDKIKENESINDRASAKEKVVPLGYVYDFLPSMKSKDDFLIMTNSDQVAGIEKILEAFPDKTIHIAAITEMSQVLYGLQKYDNLRLYPNVANDKVTELFELCGVYLDINMYGEICDSINKAFIHQMLIIGFNETRHNDKYTDDSQYYASDDEGVSKLIIRLKAALDTPEIFEEIMNLQKDAAMIDTAENYKNVM